jgi:Photosynthesis system II assembly factor YCF48
MKSHPVSALIIFLLLLNSGFVLNSFLSNEVGAQSADKYETVQSKADGWEIMELPDEFYPSMVAFDDKGGIVLMGSHIRISQDNGKTWKIITEGKGFDQCSSDGGKTVESDCDTQSKKPKKLEVKDIGDVYNAIVTDDGFLFLTSFYEHHGALWAIPLGNPKKLWFGLHFTYDGDPEDMKYWTTDFFIKLKNTVFVSAAGKAESGEFWLTTDDKGKSWHPAKFNSLSDRFFVDSKNGLRTVKNQIEQTSDGGKSWQILQTPKTPEDEFSSTFVDDKTGFAAGENGLLAMTKDGGDTWKKFDLGIKETLYGVAALDENNAWAVGTNGLVFETSDGGKTWRCVDLGLEKEVYSTLYENSIKVDKLHRTVWIIKEQKVFRKTVI